MSTPTELLPLKVASTRYGVGYTPLWEAVRDGDLPAEKFRGKWRVDPADVIAWMRGDGSWESNQAH